MPGVAVNTLDSAGGQQLAGGATFFKVEGQPIVVVGDPVAGHGTGAHAAPVMTQGAGWFLANAKRVCRAGDLASCSHASTGRGWFRVA